MEDKHPDTDCAFLQGAALDGKTVLFVDRNNRVGSSVAGMLSGWSFDVIEASTADECFLSLEARRPQIVIIGANFSGHDAMALVKNIRNNPLHRFVSVLLITSDDMTHSVADWKQAGVTAWIKEPFLPGQLAHMIEMIRF